MIWDNPEPGVYEARTTRTTEVSLEVFQSSEDDSDRYTWWALDGSRLIGQGVAVGLDNAKAECEAAAA